MLDCSGWRELFGSRFPKPAKLPNNLRVGYSKLADGSSQLHLNESVGPDDSGSVTGISKGLLSTVQDVSDMNKELERALDASDSDRVKAVLTLGANPNHFSSIRRETMLMTACFNRDVESVKHLLDAQADPNQVLPGSNNQVTPLMIAAEHGLHEAVAELIRHNADPHIRNRNGETALLAAARTNNHDAFALLVGSMVSQRPNPITS